MLRKLVAQELDIAFVPAHRLHEFLHGRERFRDLEHVPVFEHAFHGLIGEVAYLPLGQAFSYGG
ncbi:hypothetical protein GCM10028786_11620 [Flaviaesturariibacter terrae]